MIYAALDEAVSFAPLSMPLSRSLSHDRHTATPVTSTAPQQALTQLERVTHAASEVAYAAGQVTYAGLVLVTQPPDVDNLSTCRHPRCLHFLR